MNGNLKARIVAGLFAAAFICSPASATVINFSADLNAFITSFDGFTWSGGDGSGSWVNGTVDGLSGAPAAPLGYAWSNGGTNLSMSTAVPFTFNSVALYADPKWGPGSGGPGTAVIEGWLKGSLVDTYTTADLDTTPRGV